MYGECKITLFFPQEHLTLRMEVKMEKKCDKNAGQIKMLTKFLAMYT